MVPRAIVTPIVAITLMTVAAAGQQAPVTVEGLLRAAGTYLSTYAAKVSGVSLEEQYTILDVSGGRMRTPQRLTSDVVLLNLGGRVIALRDAYAIDSRPLRERQPRITAVLAKPSEATWKQAQDYAIETFRHMQADLILRLNEPSLALQFLVPEHQPRVSYKIETGGMVEGVQTVALAFEELKNPDASYIVKTRGKASAKGRFWIDPTNGRIHQTELWMQSETETARVKVTYALDPALDLLLPARMFDTYDTSESRGEVSVMGVGNYNVRRSYECRATYSNARLTRIELATVK